MQGPLTFPYCLTSMTETLVAIILSAVMLVVWHGHIEIFNTGDTSKLSCTVQVVSLYLHICRESNKLIS